MAPFHHLLVLVALPFASAFPDGAGGCSGDGAVGGLHLSPPISNNNVIQRSFQDLNLTVQVSYGVETPRILKPGDTFPLVKGRPYTLVLGPTAGAKTWASFRGFLFNVRCGQTDTTDFMDVVGGTPSQLADACLVLDQGGVTHINNDLKNKSGASLTIMNNGNSNGQCGLQVNVVILNRLGTDPLDNAEPVWNSVWGYANYTINVQKSASTGSGTPEADTSAGWTLVSTAAGVLTGVLAWMMFEAV